MKKFKHKLALIKELLKKKLYSFILENKYYKQNKDMIQKIKVLQKENNQPIEKIKKMKRIF